MEGQCHKCGRQELVPGGVRVFCHAVAALGWPVQVERPYACASCGREIRTEMSYRTGRPTRVSGGQESESGSERRLEAYARDDKHKG